MRTLLFILAAVLPAGAQSVFSNGVTLQSGSGEHQKSKPYEFKGPYVLQWGLRDLPPSKSKYPTWQPTKENQWQFKWLSLEVYDATTGRYLFTERLSGRDNYFNVPEGGKHFLRVSAAEHTAWILQAKEGRAEMTEKGPVLKTTPLPAPKSTANESASVPPPAPAPVPAAPAIPETPPVNVPEPKPSSVPGLPPGVEPAKKAAGNLPPGMTKGAK